MTAAVPLRAAPPSGTSTALTVTSAGASATTVAAGALVTLTATVTGNTAAPVGGLVLFCDAGATSCTTNRMLGNAQLTNGGVATLPFLPGIGSHSYRAVFVGTTTNATSSSAAVSLTVTGSNSTTVLVSSGSAGNYTLKAAVTTSGKSAPPTGIVSLLDLDNASASLGAPTLGNATESFTFLSGTQTITNNDAVSVVTADFNRDGHSDLAILHYKTNVVEIRLSNGDGTFRAGSVAPALSSAGEQMVVADFNEDGIPDIAAGNSAETIDILLGKGDGSFTKVGSSPQGATGFLMTVGDFNGDGHADIAVGGLNADINILLGDGTGHFAQTGFNVTSGFHPRAAAAGDFNGDGFSDLVVASGANYVPLIYLSNGDGTFSAGAAVPTQHGAIGVTVGDFNGDGKLDIAGADDGNAEVVVLQGAGDGTFTQGAVLRAGSTPIVLTVGDFDADGKSDIAVSNETSNNVSVFFGNGDGTFPSSVTQPVGYGPYGGIVSGDFNGDGAFDLAVENNSSGTVTTLISQPTATATATLSGVSPAGTGTHRIEANYAGDGNYNPSTSPAVLLTAQGAGTTLQLTVSPGSGAYGQQVLLVASLNPSSAQNHATAGEAVTFSSGGTVLGSAVLANGMASLNLSSLPVGADSIVANYPGDSYFAASQSNSVSYDATVATTSVLSASATSTTYGQPVTLTATVTPSTSQGKSTDGDPVWFYNGNVPLGSALLTSGSASLFVGSLPFGSLTLHAFFAGDTNFASSTSSGTPVSVTAATPTLTWTPPGSPTYTGTVVSPGLFNANSTVPGTFTYTASLGGSPAVPLTFASVLQAGTYKLTVTITPYNSSYYVPTSLSVMYTVLPATVTVTPANASRAFGAANPTLNAAVSGALNGDVLLAVGTTTATTLSSVGTYPITYMLNGVNAANYSFPAAATGTLTVTQAAPQVSWNQPAGIVYGTTLSSTQLNAVSAAPGSYTYTPSAGTLLYPGVQTLTVSFTPNDKTNYSSSTVTTSLVVAKAPLNLTANNFVRVYGAGNPVFTGTVDGTVNNDVLTESFQTAATPASQVGSYPIVPSINGPNAANYAVSVNSGALTISQAGTATTVALSGGNTTFTATVGSLTTGTPTGNVAFYVGQTIVGSGTLKNGVASFTGSALPTDSILLSAQYSGDANFTQSASPPALVFNVVPASPTVNVAKSGTTMDTLSVSALAGYAGTVQLSCAGLPALSKCSFLPATVSFSGMNSSTSVTLILQTGVTTAALRQGEGERPGRSLTVMAAVLGIPGLFGIGLFRRKRPGCSLLTGLLLFTFLVSGLGVAGCGSGPAASNTTTAATTPVGATSFQVIAKDANGLSQAVILSLTVQ